MTTPEPGEFCTYTYSCMDDAVEAFAKVRGLPEADPHNYHLVEIDFIGLRVAVFGSAAGIANIVKQDRCGRG